MEDVAVPAKSGAYPVGQVGPPIPARRGDDGEGDVAAGVSLASRGRAEEEDRVGAGDCLLHDTDQHVERAGQLTQGCDRVPDDVW